MPVSGRHMTDSIPSGITQRLVLGLNRSIPEKAPERIGHLGQARAPSPQSPPEYRIIGSCDLVAQIPQVRIEQALEVPCLLHGEFQFHKTLLCSNFCRS